MTEPSSNAWYWDFAQISDEGERVTHLQKDYVYYAHLAIYRFVLPYVQNMDVLDAGCGAGYGSAYLLENGARSLTGVDASAKAIAFCRYHFDRPGLHFQTADLGKLSFPPASFDFIFSSNVLEHVPGAPAFFEAAHRLLRPGGAVFLGVPPITNEYNEYHNLINPYHINIWTPRQWHAMLDPYFSHIECYRILDRLPDSQRQQALARGEPVDETAFEVFPGELDDFYTHPTTTALFLARQPRSAAEVAARLPVQRVDHSYTRPKGVIDPAHRQRLKTYFDQGPPPGLLARARQRWQQGGMRLFARSGLAWLRRRLINLRYR